MKTLSKIILTAIGIGVFALPSFAEVSKKTIPTSNLIIEETDSISWKKKKEDFKKEWNQKLSELDAKMRKIGEDIKNKSKETQAGLNRDLDEMKKESKKIKKDLDDLEQRTEANWEEFKRDVSRQYNKLRKDTEDFFKDKK